MKNTLLVLLLLVGAWANAQTIEPVNGVHHQRHTLYAFTGATIYLGDGQVMDTGTLQFKDGQIEGVYPGRVVPPAAVEVRVDGMVIYPSFIDAYAGIHVQKKAKSKSSKNKKQPWSGQHWNDAIHPQHQYRLSGSLPEKKVEDWLTSGIGIVNLHERDGIMRGTSQLRLLGDHAGNESAVLNDVSHHFSFDKGSSRNDYPSSLVGAIALFRQTMYDAQWYERQVSNNKIVHQPALSALSEAATATKIFELNHSLSLRNVADLGREFNTAFVIKGAGREYLMKANIEAGQPFILPLSFPKAWDVSDPYLARMISLEDLKHWELAPHNPVVLSEWGATVALSRDTLGSTKQFHQNLQRVMQAGMSHDELLKSLTVNPASILGVGEWMGDLHHGKQANFIVCTDKIGSDDFQVLEHWTYGKRVWKQKADFTALEGKYSLVVGDETFELKVETKPGSKQVKTALSQEGKGQWKMTIEGQDELLSGSILRDGKLAYTLSGKVSLNGGLWDGRAQDSVGEWFAWAAIRDRNHQSEENSQQDSLTIAELPEIWHPNRAFGWDSLEQESTFVIANATLWTSADTGVLQDVDIYVVDGVIKSITRDGLFPSDVKRIDAKGRHVTAGIVDEHSHIALRGGANEGGQANSAEVRMSDAIDPWNFNIYRHLAGGVTSAQLLHGSANPIGGQSAIVKLKWGASAEEMMFPDMPAFIKFALGENVKRSNHGNPKGRFPLTRMGVEQSFADAFTRAKEYDQGTPERRDLELEAIAEILRGERHITCHSYVQSEILMLLHLADSMGFEVNTFTHILEGYKVADALKEHGANASTFSDWWAYKYEVKDAIPYNASLLNAYGVNTGINSDDAEMGRRLNQEAAKSLKYGGMSEEDAMKMITINPAKMLRIDHRVGSVEVGKDADLVIWSDHPLSVYAKVDRTIIEGRTYYQRSDQEAQNQRIAQERARIIAKMLASKESNKKPPSPSMQREYHCDTDLENYIQE